MEIQLRLLRRSHTALDRHTTYRPSIRRPRPPDSTPSSYSATPHVYNRPIHPSIYPSSIHLSIHPSINSSIHPSIHPSIKPPTPPPTNPSIYLFNTHPSLQSSLTRTIQSTIPTTNTHPIFVLKYDILSLTPTKPPHRADK